MQPKLDLIYSLKLFSLTTLTSKCTIGGNSSTRLKKRNNHMVIPTFQNLLQISTDIFMEFDLNVFILKNLVLAEKKGIFKKKIYLDLYRMS